MAPSDPCPDNELIDRFVDGRAGAAEADGVRAHLGSCAPCRRLVSELVKQAVGGSPGDVDDAGGGPLLRGTVIARFVVHELIGAGAMGMVYAARDPTLDRKIALKLLRAGARGEELAVLRARLVREAQAMARLAHPNVVGIHDAGESQGQVYIAMDLVAGRSVRAWLDAAPRSWREVLDVYLQAGRGLAAAHAAGLVHRDFKPENVLIADDGRVLVSDFGMAHLEGAPVARAAPDGGPPGDLALTRTGAFLGTPAYMAPEQLDGAPGDARADVWAFAVATWEGLAGAHPFPTDDLRALRDAARAGRLREPARDVPARVRRALAAALRPDPAARTATMVALLGALEASARRRRRAVLTVAAALAAALAVGAAVRSAVVARAQTARARAGAEIARRVGEEESVLEIGLRAERLLPLHDLGPARARMRARLGAMRALLGGGGPDAAIHDALGRGLAALGEPAAARAELEAAIAGGADEPELHFALADVLLQLHDRALDEARRMGGPGWVASQRAGLDAAYLPLARLHLERSHGAVLAPPRLLDALLAYQARDLAASLRQARAAVAEAPLFYEARVLAGAVLEAEGQAEADRGDRPAADRRYLEAVAELEAAALVGRSDAGVYDALSRVWTRRLDQARWDADPAERLSLLAGALLASDRALAVAPDTGAAWTRRAQMYLLSISEIGARLPFTRAHAERCAAAARAAADRDPADALAFDMLGGCLLWIAVLDVDGGDPQPRLAAAADAYGRALAAAPGFPWAANDRSNVLSRVAEERWRDGRDGLAAAVRSVADAEHAAALDPGYALAPLSLVLAQAAVVRAGLARGVWDEGAARAAMDAAARATALQPDARPAALANLLPVRQDRLGYAVAMGADIAPAAAELAAAIAELERAMPADWDQGEVALMLLEARAVLARATGGDAGAPVGRCLALDPRRFACRLLEVEGGGDLARARALARDFPRSGRAWAALAEAHRRAGDLEVGRSSAANAMALAPELAAGHAAAAGLELRAAGAASDAPTRRLAAGRGLAALERAMALNPLLKRELAAVRSDLLALLR